MSSDPESLLRRRCLVATVLLWLVAGILMKLVFWSAGPAYYGRTVGGYDPYARLMAYLATVDRAHQLTSAMFQRGMWLSYVDRWDLSAIGIAAMPSLHVASVTLITCGAFAVRRWLGVSLTLFSLIIFVGSVSLGWHYAVDGYVGAAMALTCWWCAGRIVSEGP